MSLHIGRYIYHLFKEKHHQNFCKQNASVEELVRRWGGAESKDTGRVEAAVESHHVVRGYEGGYWIYVHHRHEGQ